MMYNEIILKFKSAILVKESEKDYGDQFITTKMQTIVSFCVVNLKKVVEGVDLVDSDAPLKEWRFRTRKD